MHRPGVRNIQRIIPARAGSTAQGLQHDPDAPDHPRSRGEHSLTASARISMAGSSPLARGARAVSPDCWATARIIPARAGSTCSTQLRGSANEDHPRSRGEHRAACGTATRRSSSGVDRGSSPLVGIIPARAGIIPARAGSTRVLEGAHPRPADHPRSRGEHQGRPDRHRDLRVSSPLARGAPDP